jgi:hypothetical protein
MKASFSLQSELKQVLGICSGSRHCFPLSLPLFHVCRPRHKGHADLTSSPPSSESYSAVSRDTCNTGQGLRSLCHLRLRFTPRADDGHAAPVQPAYKVGSSCLSTRLDGWMSSLGKMFRSLSN